MRMASYTASADTIRGAMALTYIWSAFFIVGFVAALAAMDLPRRRQRLQARSSTAPSSPRASP
jgi:hypothetical protein